MPKLVEGKFELIKVVSTGSTTDIDRLSHQDAVPEPVEGQPPGFERLSHRANGCNERCLGFLIILLQVAALQFVDLEINLEEMPL